MDLKKYDLPEIKTLGIDLLVTTPSQKYFALSRPYIGLAAYIISIYLTSGTLLH